MKVRVTKKFVLDALRAEVAPTPGRWVNVMHTPFDQRAAAKVLHNPSCARCAVGAVVLEAVVGSTDGAKASAIAQEAADYTTGDNRTTYRKTAQKLISEGKPFAALSFFFESAAKHSPEGSPVPLERTIAFVQECFPRTMVLDLDGAKAKRSLPRVK